MSRTISSGEPVHDVVDAQAQLRRIEEHRAEMGAREEGFQKVMEIGERMVDNGHFAADEVSASFDFFLVSFLKWKIRWLCGQCAEVQVSRPSRVIVLYSQPRHFTLAVPPLPECKWLPANYSLSLIRLSSLTTCSLVNAFIL